MNRKTTLGVLRTSPIWQRGTTIQINKMLGKNPTVVEVAPDGTVIWNDTEVPLAIDPDDEREWIGWLRDQALVAPRGCCVICWKPDGDVWPCGDIGYACRDCTAAAIREDPTLLPQEWSFDGSFPCAKCGRPIEKGATGTRWASDDALPVCGWCFEVPDLAAPDHGE
jgi:hypothetical protein